VTVKKTVKKKTVKKAAPVKSTVKTADLSKWYGKY
jgi:hypothetical protein